MKGMVEAGENSSCPGAGSGAEQHAVGVQAYYARNAEQLGERYGSVSFDEVHGGVADLLPLPPARALDVGAGTGRDAHALARRGYEVVAVEPVRELRDVAQELNPHERVRWVQDALPDLGRLEGAFDLVLLSAVWMHLPLAERRPAMRRLAELLAPGGLLAISLRRGEPPADRVMFDVPAQEVAGDGQRAGLELIRVVEEGTDRLGRSEVWWQSVALRKGQQ